MSKGILTLLVLLLLAPSPAGALIKEDIGGAIATDSGGIVEAGTSSSSAWGDGGGSSREGAVPCFGSVADANVARQLVTDPSVVQDGEQWMAVTCYAEGNVSWLESVYRLDDPVGAAQLLERAKDYLVVPEPVPDLAPGPDVPHLVGMPEYLAVDAADWRPWSASASVPGLSVTLTATPVETRWDLGNGDTVTCQGPGTPWRDGLGPGGEGACTYTYQWSSTAGASGGDGVYQVTASTVWQRDWTCTPACGSGSLPLLGRATTFPLTVRQAQAMITRT